MNWDIIERNRERLKGKVIAEWDNLSDAAFDQIAGKRDQLVGRLQEAYGISKEEAERQTSGRSRLSKKPTRTIVRQTHRAMMRILQGERQCPKVNSEAIVNRKNPSNRKSPSFSRRLSPERR